MMSNVLDRLLSSYRDTRLQYPNEIKYLYYDSEGWAGVFSTDSPAIIQSGDGFHRYIISSEDDLKAIVSMLEL